MAEPRGTRNTALLMATGVVAIAALVALAVGFNHAATVGVTHPTQSATPAFADTTPCASATFGAALQPLNPPADVHVYTAAPPMTIDATKLYRVTITTAKGAMVLCLQPSLAPNTVNVFVTLTRNHYYDGIPFHRVVSGFVIQAGDPGCVGNVAPAPATASGTCGQGGPGFKFDDEPVKAKYVVGCLAMANSGANTNGSQFFICSADDTNQLQPQYNLFGNLESGLNVVTQIQQGDLMQSVTVAQQQ